MIISASRRTDIPAFFSTWFMNRIRSGYCHVRNPFNFRQITEISLKNDDVDAIVFWSKNPANFVPYIAELGYLGYVFYFQYTINNYPRTLEPNLPPIEDRIETFINISKMVGAERIIWRYDPIILSDCTNADYHVKNFSYLCERLEGYTKRVMVSVIDYYRKTVQRLEALKNEFAFDFNPIQSSYLIPLLSTLVSLSNSRNLSIFTCGEETDFSEIGLPSGSCIDGKLIEKIGGNKLRLRKDPGQRNSCLCMMSKDIGVASTCLHGCQYCYATTSLKHARHLFSKHDPKSSLLIGNLSADEKKTISRQLSLF